jgi:hypothetical protein
MSTAIIALILVVSLTGIICALIYIHNQHTKKEKDLLLHQFSLLGSTYSLSFSSQELLSNGILGLDGIRRKLIYIETKDKVSSHKLIDLEEVKSCTLHKVQQGQATAENKERAEPQVQDIALLFIFKNDREPVKISFYSMVLHNIYQMADLETKAKEWQKMLSKMLTVSKELRA